jgi:hypothetical protein
MESDGAKVDEKYIQSLWLGAEHFSARFVGSVVFKNALLTDKGINLPYKQVCDILHKIPTFVQHLKRRFKFPRRHYHAGGFASIFQADLGELVPYDNKRFFLVVCDAFSSRVWGRVLQNKTADVVLKAFKSILDDAHVTPVKLETDKGSEFINAKFQTFLKKRNIYYHSKMGMLKASLAEFQIYRIKSRIAPMLRHKLSANWPSVFQVYF